MEREYKGRNPVRQENLTGCGLACVAFIVNKTYRSFLPLIKEQLIDLNNRGMFCRDLIKFLDLSGIKAKLRYIRTQNHPLLFKEFVICYINKSIKYPAGHFLVRYQGKWMDSWINYPQIIKVKAGFRTKLPGKVNYVVELYF